MRPPSYPPVRQFESDVLEARLRAGRRRSVSADVRAQGATLSHVASALRRLLSRPLGA